MAISNNLVSRFVKATKNDTKDNKKEKTVYGNIVSRDNMVYYAQIDGSNYDKSKWPDKTGLIPISRFTENVDIDGNKKVIIKIKDHTAVVTGTIDVNDDPVTVGKQVEEVIDASAIDLKDIRALWEK